MDKQNVVHPYSGILFSDIKNELLIHTTTWMKLENILLSERVRHKRSHTV